MARRTAYRGGLVASAARTAFLTTMMTTDITPAHMTEVRPASMDGMARTALCFVFLKMMMNAAITLVTKREAKFAWTDIVHQIAEIAFWVDTEQIVH